MWNKTDQLRYRTDDCVFVAISGDEQVIYWILLSHCSNETHDEWSSNVVFRKTMIKLSGILMNFALFKNWNSLSMGS